MHTLQSFDEPGPGQSQLLMMMQGELGQRPFSLRRQRQQDFATVILRPLSPHVSICLEPVSQLDRAVVLNLQLLREFPDPWPHFLRHPLNRKHELVLLFLDSGCAHRLLAEIKKLANLIPEPGQSLIIRQREFFHDPILSCSDSLLNGLFFHGKMALRAWLSPPGAAAPGSFVSRRRMVGLVTMTVDHV